MPVNPFVYGEIVPRASFVGREAELDRLVRDLAARQKVFLMSPRRYGKSSLIRHALTTLERRRVATVEVTVSSYSSYVTFLEGYARAVASLETRAAARSWWAEMFAGIAAELTPAADAGGDVVVSFPGVRTPRDTAQLAQQVFALPAKVAARLRRPVVVALDEFQAVKAFNGGSVEHALRAAVQRQRHVGYVFAGSAPTLMEEMIGPQRPFYKAGPVVRLARIPADVFARFVEERCRRTGIRPDPDLGAAVVDLGGNLPYDVQRLAHEMWDDVTAAKRRRAGLEDLHATLHRLLSEQATFFETTWQRLTLAQRSVLRAVVLERGAGLLSADVRVRHRLGGASTVQVALAALQRLDLIAREDDGRYTVIDSLMREWVARTTH